MKQILIQFHTFLVQIAIYIRLAIKHVLMCSYLRLSNVLVLESKVLVLILAVSVLETPLQYNS